MIIDKAERKGIIIVKLIGKFDIGEVDEFEHYLNNLLIKHQNFALDMKDITFLDSAAIGSMLKIYNSVSSKNGKMYIVNPNSHIQYVLESAMLTNYMPIITLIELHRLFPEAVDDIKFEVVKNENSDYIYEDFNQRKIPVDFVLKLFDERPILTLYLEEDCHGFLRGRKLQRQDVELIKRLGYETIWVTREFVAPNENSHEFLIRETMTKLEEALFETFFTIREEDFERRVGNVKYLSGEDLFNPVLNPLQQDGAQTIYLRVFNQDLTKLERLDNIIREFISYNIRKITILDNRSLGYAHLKDSAGTQFMKASDEYLYRLIRHSIATTLMFITAAKNVYSTRARQGAIRTTARLEKGEKKFDYAKRFLFEYDYIASAALGCLLHDFGYCHNRCREIIEKELKTLAINEKLPEDDSKRISESERSMIMRHVNVGYNIYSAFEENQFASPIANNIIKFHHCFLDGSGYPSRKESVEGNQINYKTPIHELTRLFNIINFFDNFVNRKPYRLPVRRSTAVEYLITERVYPRLPDGTIDKYGIWELETTKKQPNKFDGYLVDEFLNSINLYKIDERVVLRHKKTNNILHAQILEYNELPHRPVVKIIHQQKEGIIDLSQPQYQSWIVDELYPCVAIK